MRTSIWFRIFLNHPVYQFAMFIDTRMLCLFARGGNLRVGQVDCHGGHFVRYSKCWAPCVLPMFLPWFYTLLHIVYHIFPCFTNVFTMFSHVRYFYPSTTDLVASNHQPPLRLALPHDEKIPGFRPTRWAPENQLGK